MAGEAVREFTSRQVFFRIVSDDFRRKTLVVSLAPRHLSHLVVSLVVVAVAVAGMAVQSPTHANALRGWTFEPFQSRIQAASYLNTHPMLGGGLAASTTREGVMTYIVQPGDSLSEIAWKFGVSTQTVIWANDLSDVNLVKVGDHVRIPPTTGVLHVVEAGENLADLAAKYSVPVEAVIAYPLNRIENPDQLISGEMIMFPGGIKPPPPPVVAAANPGTSAAAAGSPGGSAPPAPPSAATRGIRPGWPVAGTISQYFSGGHPALDIAAPYGSPLHAVESGTVVVAAFGWNGGYGTMVDIDHGNGYVSRYAHMSTLAVEKGQYVAKGQYLGNVGVTGITTGPHVHFEILFKGVKVNPLNYLG